MPGHEEEKRYVMSFEITNFCTEITVDASVVYMYVHFIDLVLCWLIFLLSKYTCLCVLLCGESVSILC